ncbi:type II secretion system protein J [Frigoribacterium sp. ACAM 257]|uniref:PulJ/GspJ family protein n=1 Tax=Frigoribacterium sp. ACAM 257 TaxID=2508998 RepID=UPI00174C0634|nr:prepilin-type N-terminal cleavage/methylation domain-containing protein [Frigoribacterium sp. ACAM 257]
MIRVVRRRLGLERPGAGDAGVSLAELLVAMMVFAVLLSLTGGFMISAYRANQTNNSVDRTTRTASTALLQMTRMIRAASDFKTTGGVSSSAFVTMGSSDVTLVSYVNLADALEKPVKVQYVVEGTKLVERRWAGLQSVNDATLYTFPTLTSTVTLAEPVLAPAAGGPALFSYFQADRTTVAADPTAIGAVRVQLQIGTSSRGSDSTLLVNTVGINNGSSQGTP